jgi:hypothetical protein
MWELTVIRVAQPLSVTTASTAVAKGRTYLIAGLEPVKWIASGTNCECETDADSPDSCASRTGHPRGSDDGISRGQQNISPFGHIQSEIIEPQAPVGACRAVAVIGIGSAPAVRLVEWS